MAQDSQITSSACHCINLRRASNAVSQYYDRMLRPSGLTLNQYSILSSIRKIEPCSVTGLSEQTRLDRTTLVRNLKPLFAAGWILDEAAPGNRRSKVRTTDAGMERLQAARLLWKKAQENLEAYMGEDALAILTEWLLKLEKLNPT